MLVASTASGTEQVKRSRNGIGSLGQVRIYMEIGHRVLDSQGRKRKNLILIKQIHEKPYSFKRIKVSAQRRNLTRLETKLRGVLAHRLGDVGLRQMAVMLLDHARGGMTKVLRHHHQRHPGHHRE